MQPVINPSQMPLFSFRTLPLLLVLVPIVGVIVSTYVRYLNGEPLDLIFEVLTDWGESFLMSSISYLLLNLASVFTGRSFTTFPYLFYFNSISFNILEVLMNRLKYPIGLYLWRFSNAINLFLFLMVLRFLIQHYNGFVTNFRFPSKETETKKSKDNIIEDKYQGRRKSPDEILGKGNSLFDKVIGSITCRASEASTMAITCLIIMVAIVLIGGSASVGTVALNDLQKSRNLEKERNNLITIAHKLDSGLNDKRYIEIKKITNEIYGENSSYAQVIRDAQKKSQVSWEDIAMRVTIAALTLFLVQIFFHIYKYNQQKAAHLFSRAEIIELFKEGGDQRDLRASLLAKMDLGPSFENGPTPPTDQLLNMIDKARGGK